MQEKDITNLGNLFLFQLLDNDELQKILPFFSEKRFGKGVVIFSENDEGDSMYIIKTGIVRITKKEKEIALLNPGDFFGEIALFEYVRRTATASAVEESELLEIKRASFDELFQTQPVICAKILYQMMCEMTRRLRKTSFPEDFLVF